MRVLNANVEIEGSWWGPDYGNADQVPAEVAELVDADVWTDWPDQPTEPTPDVPSLGEWLAASTGDEVVAFVDEWVDQPAREQTLLDFLAMEHEGEGRQDVVDTLVAALPTVRMTDEEKATAAAREAAQAVEGDTGSDPGSPPPLSDEDLEREAAEAAAQYAAWVHDTSIDGIEEELVKIEDPAERGALAARILEVDGDTANGGKARKGLFDRLRQYLPPAGD